MDLIQNEITGLLLKWGNGDSEALDQLVPLIYPELRRIARRHMGKENPDHTLQTSALINEAYLRLLDLKAVEWNDRSHFFAFASRVMRNILVDHARKYTYKKRGGRANHSCLDEMAAFSKERAKEFVALDDALRALEKIDERKLRIVELRFFGGLTVDETAEVLKLSPITIKREWRFARAFLLNEIDPDSADSKL